MPTYKIVFEKQAQKFLEKPSSHYHLLVEGIFLRDTEIFM